MIHLGRLWLGVFLGAFLLLVMASPVWAMEDNEQSWILLERGRPQEAQVRCLSQNDFLSRWVLATAEKRMSAKPTAHDPVSLAARAFELEEFPTAAKHLQSLIDHGVSPADELALRLNMGACLVEMNSYGEADLMLTQAIEQAHSEGRLASRCYGQFHRGRARGHLQQWDLAVEDLQATIKLSRRLGTHRWAALAALALSDISRLNEDQDDALYWLEASLQYFHHGGYLSGQIEVLQQLGDALCAMEQCEEGLLYLEEARALAQAGP